MENLFSNFKLITYCTFPQQILHRTVKKIVEEKKVEKKVGKKL